MIGKITIGKSFRGCINYCLDNKPGKELVEGRAEVLVMNYCDGNKNEIIKQFDQVRKLNLNLEKPVMHLTLSFAPGEQLSKSTLEEIIWDCAEHLGFEKNQFISLEHTDTEHQHVHLVVNRIGYDRKTLSDSNNFKQMVTFCRKTERKFGLQEVLSPKKFLKGSEKLLPRSDERKEKLRETIYSVLKVSNDFAAFEKAISNKGYRVEKARGISFYDAQKVKVKGSEIGFSLSVIENFFKMDMFRRNKILNLEQKKKLNQSFEAVDTLLKKNRNGKKPLRR